MNDDPQGTQQLSDDKSASSVDIKSIGKAAPLSSSSQPVSITPGKEHAPVVVESKIAPIESMPEIPAEVKEVGVEVVADKETIDLRAEDKKVGFSAQNEATPVSTTPSNTVQFPISKEEAEIIVSKKDTRKSLTWLAALIIRQAKIMHGKLFSQQS